ncbi:beta-hydroxydecanoyl-ACP dehydratase [Nocardia sp. CDC160]|uniref:beta-hydroxydecanoyl-ACP dehydratase n=1 Tax=Nocardia sp. CDC160 TaxID=3112166 RepID=UPI002DBFD1BA|nr:beta-hydroxydecanoyl-ACP dehydratase [Nocardia sp. CDC160]MEC3918596.1 beta-hydroxydecanoyl-ACP dehydratase [Nocardia sp. CDC160]
MTTLDFDGIPFNPLGMEQPTPEPPTTAPNPLPPVRESERLANESTYPAAGSEGASTRLVARSAARARPTDPEAAVHPVAAEAIAQIRAGVVEAHRAALTAQTALQREIWRRARGRAAVEAEVPALLIGADEVGRDHVAGPIATPKSPAASERSAQRRFHAAEGAFKPLARTTVVGLDRDALEMLTVAEMESVFGGSHRRDGVEVAARLAASTPLVLTEVSSIELYGGIGNGRVVARFEGDPRAAALQAAEVFAVFTGMPLCLSGSTLTGGVGDASVGTASGAVELVVDRLDVVPRPFLQATARLDGVAEAVVVTVMVAERAGAGVGPGEAAPGLLLNEFHMAHLARGDQAIAMGPEFAPYTGVRATRLPTGGLLLVDRVLRFDGARGNLESASYDTEYDSPADSWYYGDTANDSMPHFVYMETSLQAALLMGYYAGPTLTQPGTTLSLRNLGGTATVLRQIDLRDKTIQQSSRLLSTTILPGSSLQTFDYTLSVDGQPFYQGETMFGYFSDQALGNQTGLDAGRSVPSWLTAHPEAATRVIDVAARRADPAARACSRRKLALIDRVEVVDEGGNYGAGYLHSLRTIDPEDWFFARHFHLDPVIPGSLGVESVIHAVQEWMLDSGFADGMADPAFRIPAGIAFSWRYRGQFLPTDGTVELEAHIKSVRRDGHGATVVVDGSLWKPGLRIYELIDLAVELADRKASE